MAVTGTPQYGYPDFQSSPQWAAGFQSGSDVDVTSAASITVDSPTASFASTYLSVSQSSGTGVTVTVTYYVTSAKTATVATWTYIVNTNSSLNVILPNIGIYLEVVISTGQSGTQVIDWQLQLVNTPVTVPTYPVPTNYEGAYDTSIGAGATRTVYMPQVMEGTLHTFIDFHAGGADATVYWYEYTESGAIKGILAYLSNLTNSANVDVATGRNPVALVINNNGTHGRAMDFSLLERSN